MSNLPNQNQPKQNQPNIPKNIRTPDGIIQLVVPNKYILGSLVTLVPVQYDPFIKIFKVKRTGSEGLSDVIKIMVNNDLVIGDEEMSSHPQFYFWLSKSEQEIKDIMDDKGVWIEGVMNKYFAMKLLLFCHTIVESGPPTISHDNTNFTLFTTQNTTPNTDTRSSLTTGIHYETLPKRDFQIYEKREKLVNIMLDRFGTYMIKSFSGSDLRIMYEFYDREVFGSVLSSMIKNKGRTVGFDTNLTSKSKAGIHSYDSSVKSHILKVSSHLICNLFENKETVKINGMNINNRISCLINVFEHEITHLYCSLMGYTRKIKAGKGKMYYGPHGKLFQELVFRFFGHTDFRHNIGHGDATEQLSKEDCYVHMNIYFDSQKQKKNNNGKPCRIYGKIGKINPKRCKVNTEDGSVYDVPYSMIRKSNKEVTIPVKKIINTGNIKSKYSVGMRVKFRSGKNGYKRGKIIKINPKRARVNVGDGTYDVSYEMLLKF